VAPAGTPTTPAGTEPPADGGVDPGPDAGLGSAPDAVRGAGPARDRGSGPDPADVVREAMAELRPGDDPAGASRPTDDIPAAAPEPANPGVADSEAADPEVADPDAADPEGGAGPRPMTVLFQAPAESTPARRRRAVASAGPAQPALFAPPAAGEPSDGDSAEDPAATAAASGEGPTGRTGRRRKRGGTVTTPGKGDDAADQDQDPVEVDAGAGDVGRADDARGGAVDDDEAADDVDDEVDDEVDEEADDEDDDAEGDDEGDDEGEDDDSDEDSDDSDDADDSDDGSQATRRRRRRGGRGRRRRRTGGGTDAPEGADAEGDGGDARREDDADDGSEDEEESAEGDDAADGLSRSARRRRRRRRRSGEESSDGDGGGGDVTAVRGSTRLEAKRQRRREGRDSNRRRTVITEAEFLARRESVDRTLLVRERDGRTQIAVLEDGVLVEHYVTRASQQSMIGNVHLGKVQNVLPSMEAAFVDIGRGRNAVLYAGEVNWDAANLTSKADRRIEAALKPGDPVLVQVTKDPIGHKGARLSSQISLPGRFVVLVPGGSMTGISRKLPETERNRLKRILKRVVPEDTGVIVRTAAEGAAEEDIERDVARLAAQWDDIRRKSSSVSAPALLYSEPDLAIRVVRDVFNEDISRLVVSGDDAWDTLQAYVAHVAPDLVPRVSRWEPQPDGPDDLFAAHRVDEQIAKGLERKVWLPSGGSLVIDRTEAMTVVDVNTGKFTGSGGDLEETVTRNNLEAAEEIVRQLRLRDIGGIIVVDFIDMVLESNRQLVLRRLVECLGRDRTKHQVAEVTSLGLVQMTRKRVGQGLLEAFSTPCETCHGRGVLVHDHPVESGARGESGNGNEGRDRPRRSRRVDQPA
jgi:ribonuclease E